MRSTRTRIALVLLVAVCVAATAVAQSRLPRLPKAFDFRQTGDSPGKVTFNHETHVDEAKPSCTSCHPKLFKILNAGLPAEGGAITHNSMKAGRACGACHDGKKAFAAEDCAMCHKAPPSH
jgi:c(7)-type cytochrome triheme protein